MSDTSLNYLLPSKARLDVIGAKTFSINAQVFKIPRMYGYIATQPSPVIDVPLPGNKLVFDVLEVSFLVTENIESWIELQEWMFGIYHPQNTNQFKDKKLYLEEVVLTIYTAANNPIMQIKYHDAFPIRLDEVTFDVQDTTAEPVKTKVEFAFLNYDVVKM